MMASMGEAVGEKITRAVERANKEKLPIIIFCLFRRCQNAGRNSFPDADGEDIGGTEASSAMRDFLYISVLTDPTTGGVTASFAMLEDDYSGRTKGTDWICRTASHRADNRTEASERISDVQNFCWSMGLWIRS